MKLVSQKHNKSYAGQSVILPVVGEATFNEDGTIDVADDKAEEVIKATAESFGFEPADKPEAEKSETKRRPGRPPKDSAKAESEGESEDDDEGDEEPSGEEDAENWKELIDNASTEELLTMAKEAGVAGGDVEKIAAMTDKKLRKEVLKAVMAPKK